MTLTPEQQKILSGITLETTPKIKPTLEVKSTSTPFTDEQLKMLDSVEVEEEPTVRLHPSQKSAEPEYITVYDRGNTSRKVNKAEYLAEQQPKKEEKSGPSVLADIGRVTADTLENIDPVTTVLKLKQIAEEAKGMFGLDNEAAKYAVLTKFRTDQLLAPLKTLETVTGTEGSIFSSEGDIKKTETTTGAIAAVVPFVAGGWKIASAKKLANLSTFKKGIVGGGAMNQILADPDSENIFNAVNEYMAPNIAGDFVSYMSAKETDTQLERRLKLVGEELTLGVLGEVVGGAAKLSWYSSKMFGKGVIKLSNTEQGQIMMAHLKAAKNKSLAPVVAAKDKTLEAVTKVLPKSKDDYFEEAKFSADLKKREGTIAYEEAPKAVKQIAKQNSNGMSNILKRLTGQFFTSRGYWSKRAYNAFENSQYAQRQAITRAENTANRLQKHLDAIVETKEGEDIISTVNKIFADQIDFTFAKGLSFEDKVKDVSNQFNLPKNISTELVNARTQIDELSKDLLHSSVVPDDFKEAIAEGVGSYLRRSYRLYEDKGYMPSDDVRKTARDFLTRQYQQADPNLSELFATRQADNYLDDLLKDADLKEVGDYLHRVRKVNTNILEGRKDIAPELRAFMGEIKEPSENIILTVTKMAKLAETNKFLGTLKELGESGGYIFKNTDARDTKVFNEIIKGTGTTLDGMYTSKEMLKAIQQKQGQIGMLRGNKGYNKFLKVQGTVQKFKTVYSHMTHMKNLTGGAVMSAANGVNPFGKNTKTVFNTLRNSIAQGGDEVLDASYEKYLRLGIINTNVTVNEYRELLETGYRANNDTGFEWLEGMTYGSTLNKSVIGKGQKGLKRVEDIYVATDDYFKINTFLKELDSLKRADTGKSLDVLEAEAARITQNTYANYDRVPFGIKALKDLPIGSFVSFPAESIRVQVNILRQGAKELSSGNPVLVSRGMERMSGMLVTQGGVAYGATASAKLVFGEDDEKAKAAHILTEKPWSKTAPRIWGVDKDTGDILYWDTASHDPFDAFKAPLRLIVNEVMSKNLKGEELDTRLFGLAVDVATTIAKPFVSATILADVADDVVYAVRDPAGRTRKGKEMFPVGMSIENRISNVSYHILDKTMPGSLKSAKDLVNVINEKPNRTTGKIKSLELELAKNMTSINAERLDVQDAMLYAIKDYNREVRNLVSLNVNFENTPSELKDRYATREKYRYKADQELYRKVNASITLIGKPKTAKYLIDAGVGREQLGFILAGLSNPKQPSKNQRIAMLQKTPSENPKEIKNTINSMMLDFQSFSGVPLNVPESPSELALEKMERMRKSTGGEVSEPVPNAPIEPDERINKLTGLPYNEGAGTAYMDEDDPMRRMNMAAGGRVKKSSGGKLLAEHVLLPLADLIKKFSKKDVSDEVAEEAANKILRNFEGSDDMPSLLDDPDMEDYIKLETKALLEEKHDLTTAQLQEQFPDVIKRAGGIGGEEFSKVRGYTADERETFEAASSYDDVLGDTSDIRAEIQYTLDDLKLTQKNMGGRVTKNSGGKVLNKLKRNCA